MEARLRLLVYVALTVVLLIALPWALPPDHEPSYGPPPWSSTTHWAYGVATAQGGPRVPNGGIVEVSVSTIVPLPHSAVGADLAASSPEGSVAGWSLETWSIALSNLGWTSLTWACGAGAETVQFTSPLPWGGSVPFSASRTLEGQASATEQGACANGTGTASVSGDETLVIPPGGNECTLYVCPEEREYLVDSTLDIMGPSGAQVLDEHWQALYDPVVSGYRWITVGPGTSPEGPGSLNLTLLSYESVNTLPSPAPYIGEAESLGLILLGPGLALLSEMVLARRETRREEQERHDLMQTLAQPGTEVPLRPEADEQAAYEPPRD